MLARLQGEPGRSRCETWRCASPTRPAPASASRSPTRRPSRCSRWTSTRQKVQRAGARGTAYPYEIVPLLTGRDGTFTEYDFDAAGAFGPGRAAGRAEQGRRRRRCGHHADRPVPGGHDPGRAVRRPDEGAGHGRRAECALVVAAHRPGRADGCPGRVVRPVLRREDLDGQRHREHGLGGPRPAPAHHVHPGRRRGQRRRGRDQRRRPAVLERRGHDAACTPRAS